jgi:hypothetical protein
MREDFAPNFGDKRAASCIKTTHSLPLSFTTEIPFLQENNNITVVSYPP